MKSANFFVFVLQCILLYKEKMITIEIIDGGEALENIVYLYTLLVCLGVCLYPINVKTAEPIGSKFCVGLHMYPGKV